MNQEPKQDDLLAAFENPEMDPTPEIAPVMPETSQVPPAVNSIPNVESNVSGMPDTSSVKHQVDEKINMDNILPPELQNTKENVSVQQDVPVNNNIEVQPVEPQSVVENTQSEFVNQEVKSIEPQQEVDPSISVAQSSVPEKKEEPDSLKKNLKFIAILFAVIVAFILLLPTIMNLLGSGY